MSYTPTVGDLRRALECYDNDFELGFEGGLTFNRVKTRDKNLVVVEFTEFQAEFSPRFRKRFPEVKVAFCTYEWDGSIIQGVDVPRL